MKKVLVLAALLIPFAVFAQEQDAVKAAQERANTVYAIGYMMGDMVRNQLIITGDSEMKAIAQGVQDSLTHKKSQVDLETYKSLVIKRYESDSKTISEKRMREQAVFLDTALKEKNAVKLEQGIIFQPITKGKGARPKATDTVRVNYKGTLIDGRVFDSSYTRGEPLEFSLTQVISCWTIGLQQMGIGDKAKLTCPAETAYGNRKMGIIDSNSVLVFEVELLDIVRKSDAAKR